MRIFYQVIVWDLAVSPVQDAQDIHSTWRGSWASDSKEISTAIIAVLTFWDYDFAPARPGYDAYKANEGCINVAAGGSSYNVWLQRYSSDLAMVCTRLQIQLCDPIDLVCSRIETRKVFGQVIFLGAAMFASLYVAIKVTFGDCNLFRLHKSHGLWHIYSEDP